MHVDLAQPLAEMIVAASRRSQLLITTHSSELAQHVKAQGNCKIIELEKVAGETVIRGEEVRSARAEVEDDDAAAVRAYRAALKKNEPED